MNNTEYRLRSMPYAQCRVRIADNHDSCDLISYSTSVCFLKVVSVSTGEALRLYCSGTYSCTTARHINRFTREFCGRNLYHECKAAINHNQESPMYPGWYYVADFKKNSMEWKQYIAAMVSYELYGKRYYGTY